jgi:hypothetical protein
MQLAIALQHQALENVDLGVEGHFKAKPLLPLQQQHHTAWDLM